jgi:hypothetical protein
MVKVSAHIVVDNENGTYVALTATTNLKIKEDDGSITEAIDGYFFL